MPHINRRFTDFSGFPVQSVSSPSSRWCLKWVMPPGSLPLPPRGGRALRPILVVRFILRFLEAMQCRQRLSWSQVDASPASCRNLQNSNGSTNCHDIHQFLLLWQYGCGLRSPSLSISRITSSERPNSSIVFLNHRSRINRSWMFLYFRFMHFFWSWFAVWYSLQPSFFPYLWPCGRPSPDVKVRDREEIQHGLDVLLVFCCIIYQEVPARAVDDANVPIRQTCSALCFWLHIDYLA